MASTKIKVAIAGAGMVSRHHLLAWSRLAQVEVVAICARNLNNAENRAAEFNIATAYDDVNVMLDREKPDVLDIATPPEIHRKQAIMAADRGIHILCQKPMTPNLVDSERLVADVGERVRFMVHENWRFRPQYRQAAEWLMSGRAGPVREFQLTVRSSGLVTKTENGRPIALDRQPFFSRLKRFLVMEVLIHHLDTIRFLLGPVQVVAAHTARVSPEVIGEDMAIIGLKAVNGAIGTITGNFSAAGFSPNPGDRLELIGEKASILFENNELHLIGDKKESIRFNLQQAYQQSYDNAIAHFVWAIENSEPFETDRLENLETLRLVEDAYRLAGI